MRIAIVGGTGKLGSGLAVRWARSGNEVVLGSRQAEKARLHAATLVTGGHGFIEGADQVKATSVEAIRELQQIGITVYMLTGDSETTAKAIAEKTGITHYKAGVLPDQKAAFVKQLQSEGLTVAMVGDGINDSAALAQADVSIAAALRLARTVQRYSSCSSGRGFSRGESA